MSLLSIEQIEHAYFGRKVLDGVSLRLDRGERLALIGDNGAGKTTLMRLIMGLEKPNAGRIVLAGQAIPAYLSQMQDVSEYAGASSLMNPQLARLEDELRTLEHEIAATAQQPVAQARVLTRYGEKTAAFEAMGGYDFPRRMNEALRGLGLDEDVIMRPVHSLSGGEKMRVALARMLLSEPDLLLLDEPTNHLDLDAMEWLERFLIAFKGGVMLISHDRTFIDHTATAVAELAGGHITVRPGNYTQFRDIEAADQYTTSRELKKMERELAHQKSVTQTMLSHRKMSSYHAREKVVAKITEELGHIRERSARPGQKLLFSFLPTASEGDPSRILLQADQLSRSFGDRLLFRDASFYLRCGERLFLLGPNGCGKSTLLAILLGRLPADSGTVSLSSRSVFGLMSQEFSFPDESATILQTLLNAYDLDDGQARSMLARYGFRDVDVFKSVSVLSGGERARLYLCHLLLDRPDLLFLDEPTNHLDIRSREILETALLEYSGALLVVSHDRYLIERLATRVLGFIGAAVLPFDRYSDYSTARDKAAAACRVVRTSPTGGSTSGSTGGSAGGSTGTSIKQENRATGSGNGSAGALAAGQFAAATGSGTAAGDAGTSGAAGTAMETAAAGDGGPATRAMGANRARERREIALRKEHMRQLEQRIETDEARKAEMEQAFAGNSDPGLYDAYASLVRELEEAYTEYLQVAEELG